MVRWWVVLSVVGILAGLPGIAAARLMSNEMTATSAQTETLQLDSVGGASVEMSCDLDSGASVTVRWKKDHSALADGFEILRRDANGQSTSVGVVSVGGDAHFFDDKVAPGATYTYAVRAVNAAWNGDESATAPVTIPSC